LRNVAIILIAMTLLVAGTVLPAAAGSYYLSGNLGMVFVDDSDLSADGYGKFGKLSFDDGYSMNVALGNTLGDGLRSELELFYRANDVDKGSASVPEVDIDTSGSVNGKVSGLGAMANFYFDFENKSAFKPFIGVGGGYANVDLEVEDASDDDWVFAYQAMVGCGYAVSKELTLDLQYRYFATEDPEYKVEGAEIDAEYRTHNLLLGLRYYF